MALLLHQPSVYDGDSPPSSMSSSPRSTSPSKPSVAFNETCVIIESAEEKGLGKKLSLPHLPRLQSPSTPSQCRKLRLSLSPSLTAFLPSPPTRLFRRLSNASLSPKSPGQLVSPTSPPAAYTWRGQSSPALPLAVTQNTAPLSPCCEACQPAAAKGREEGWVPPMSERVERQMKVRELEVELGLRVGHGEVLVYRPPTQNSRGGNAVEEEVEVRGGAGGKVQAIDEVEARRSSPGEHRGVASQLRIASTTASPAATPALASIEEDHPEAPPSSFPFPSSSTSPGRTASAHRTSPSQSVWLCTPPPRSPTSPLASPASAKLPRTHSGTSFTSLTRSCVVRTMSTGRLADDYCLSGHSERALKANGVGCGGVRRGMRRQYSEQEGDRSVGLERSVM